MITPPEHDAREAVLNARFQYWSTLAATFVTSVGTAVLVGWALGSETLKRVAPGLPAMNPVSAVSFVLAGFALALLRESRLTPRRRLMAQLLGAGIFLVGTAKLVELMTGIELNVDRVLFTRAIDSDESYAREVMSPYAALNFALFGLALVYFGGETRLSHRLSQICGTLGTIGALLPLTAYIYGADVSRGFGSFIPMAVHTAVCFIALGTGLLIAPGTQAIKLVSRADEGGRIVRRFFPAVVVMMLALGYLRLAGQRAGWYETELGAALTAVGSIVALGALLWWNAEKISRADRRRVAVESELQFSESALRAANAALAEQVRTDSLTGVRNRMSLDEELARAVRNLHRYDNEVFSVLMLDVDYFKRYNDSYGHLAGDEVLRRFARLLEDETRDVDIVGRYGGEEFVVILPHTGEGGAREIAERLRATVERSTWPNAPITVSIGVATATPVAGALDGDSILNDADMAMYLAKQSGRNAVYHAADVSLAENANVAASAG